MKSMFVLRSAIGTIITSTAGPAMSAQQAFSVETNSSKDATVNGGIMAIAGGANGER